nr:MAG TPA: hypothetical protein [Caudoviricetes sp.]
MSLLMMLKVNRYLSIYVNITTILCIKYIDL